MKKLLTFILIICGVVYLTGFIAAKSKDTNLKDKVPAVNDKARQVSPNIINKENKLLLVNSDHGLSKAYKPQNLTKPNIPFAAGVDQEEKHVAGIIVEPLEELVSVAKEDRVILLGKSGYRSYQSQLDTYTSRIKTEGKKLADAYVAKPGFSEHQTGLCIDITNQSGYFAKGTEEADWLEENCYKFGFIIRYPYGKKSITGIEYEPWHIRYVGKEAAKYIYDNGITLEEYLEK